MKKLTICDLIAEKVNEEIEKRGTDYEITTYCASFGDEIVFMHRDDHFIWRAYRLSEKQCEKFFVDDWLGGEDFMDKLIRKAT